MNKMVNNIKKNWKRIVSVFMVLVLVVTSVNMQWNVKKAEAAQEDYVFMNRFGDSYVGGDTMPLRRTEDTLTLISSPLSSNDTWEWRSSDSTILEVERAANEREADITLVSANAIETTLTVFLDITHKNEDDTTTFESIPLKIEIKFAVSERIDDPNCSWGWIHEGDAEKALIMEYGAKIELGTSDATDAGKLNLIFGDATKAEWLSDNLGVASLSTDDDGKKKYIEATGAGHTTIKITYTAGTSQGNDQFGCTIDVYVRPRITGKDIDKEDFQAGPADESVTIESGTTLDVSVNFGGTIGESFDNKLTWAITKEIGADQGIGKTVLVRDSLGNRGDGWADISLSRKDDKITVDAKAGNYVISFYVAGTYPGVEKDEDDKVVVKEGESDCKPVKLEIKVPAKFTDKTISVNINDSYDLSDAFNIPADVLEKFTITAVRNFEFEPGKTVDSLDYISLDGTIVRADKKKLGYACVEVTAPSTVNILGVEPGTTVRVIIRIIETFNLDRTSATLYVGQELDLSAVIGSDPKDLDMERFDWTISDTSYLNFVPPADETGKHGNSARVRALRETPTGEPVVVTLTWRDSDGINHTASCRITILGTATNLQIDPTTWKLEAGGSSKILSTNATGTQNFQWLSSDPGRVQVTALEGNTKAEIVAPANATPGQAVITVYNRDNGESAVCVVTVTAPMTRIIIDKGETYSTTLAEGFVQMNAIWEPSYATNTELIWTSDHPEIASVNEYGRVTLHQVGAATITVQPVDNPNNVYANCLLTIREDPITQITPDVTYLEMITGDTYEVSLNIIPENPTDKTIQWTSSDESIVTVNNNGVLTAVSAGEAVISISGGRVGRPVTEGSGETYIPPATIRVKVRNRLQKIEFSQRVTYVPLGGTRELTVLFTPDVDINDTLIWNSSDTSIVTVSEEGVLTGIAVGSAMVTCYAEDMGPENMISCMVYVTDQAIIPATDLALLPEEATIEVGQTLQMDPVFTPENTTNQFIEWSSSDPKIASIDPQGLVSALEVGEVTITALYTDTPDGRPWILYSKITVVPATVEATEFDVTPDSMNIKVNESFTITPIFTPENTTDKSVEYQTTDESVAMVSENGVVTGVGPGDCIIQCQANSGGFIATTAVHVENAIKFSLSPSYREIAVGKSFTISKVTVPANADKTAVWTSSNTKIATVSSSGKVTAKKIGTCTITCTLTEYNQSATCRVKVAKLNSKVSLDKKNIRIGVGSTYRLKATVWTNNSKTPAVKWKSANKKIASVSSKGKVKGKRVGVTKVTVTTKDKIKAKATCRVTVIKRASSIKINKRYAICYIGRSIKLKASVRPKTATIKKIKWSSSNRNVAVVSGSGKVTGMSEGDVTITAMATDGSGKKATCLVKVLEDVPVSSVVVAQTNLTMKKGDSTKLTYSVLPKNNSDNLSFASDNKRVATVNSNGKIKAVGTGTANITILAGSGVTTTVVVNVVDLNKYSVNMRQYDTETLRVFGTNSNVTWYSANNRVATVDGGVVTGRSIGSTYIYAYVGGCKLACRVTITSVNR